MPTENQIRAESPWMKRGVMRPEEIAALLEGAATTQTPSRDALFDGSNAHLLNDAGDGFESSNPSVEQ